MIATVGTTLPLAATVSHVDPGYVYKGTITLIGPEHPPLGAVVAALAVGAVVTLVVGAELGLVVAFAVGALLGWEVALVVALVVGLEVWLVVALVGDFTVGAAVGALAGSVGALGRVVAALAGVVEELVPLYLAPVFTMPTEPELILFSTII
jgi:hypothetical protein